MPEKSTGRKAGRWPPPKRIPVAVQRRSYFLNDMADKVVWMPDGCDDWPPDE